MNRFLWAKFQLMDLKEALTKSALRTILGNLPESLSDTYLRIIRRTSQSTGGQAKLEMMRKIFCWVAVARRPLHIHELEEAVALDSSDTYLHTDRLPKDAGARLIGDCNNLVVLNKNDHTVVFAHHTVEQFLFSTQEYSTELSELMDLTSCDYKVGKICLAYLNFSDFETQLAKAPAEIHVEAPLAEEIVWSSVPFGGHIRGMLTRSALWRTKPKTHKATPLKYAAPVISSPTETLHRKYTLLEYIIQHWVFHTSSLRPHWTAWPEFRHLALYRQLDFEFRPWNDNVLRKQIEVITEKSQETLERSGKSRSSYNSTDRYATQLGIYAWAISHDVGSLFGLLDRDIMGQYLMVRAEVPSDLYRSAAEWETQWTDLEDLLSCRQTRLGIYRPANAFQQHAMGWSGASSVGLWQVVYKRLGDTPLQNGYHLKFLEAEITRWAGSNTWTDILIEAAVCAMHCGDRLVFEGVWEKCIQDTRSEPHGVDWHASTSFKVIEALLCEAASQLSTAHLEWDIIFILQRYLTSQQLFWTLEHSPTCKSKARIGQILLVVVLALKRPITEIIKSWTGLGLNSQGFRPFDPVGDWKASVFGSMDSFLAIYRFQQVNVLALMEQLAHGTLVKQLTYTTLQLSYPSHSRRQTAHNRFSDGISRIVALWDMYGRCFSVEIFENDHIELLKCSIKDRNAAAARALIPLYQEFLKESTSSNFLQKLRSELHNAPDDMLQILVELGVDRTSDN
jgi:hypothetical protein